MYQTSDHSGASEGGVRRAAIAVFAAFAAVFFGTATIFQIEDDNPLTEAAFEATPLLGASLLAAHLAVLGFCVGAVLAMLVNVASAITHTVKLRSGSPGLFADSIDHVTITGYKLASGLYFSEFAVANVFAGAFTFVAAIVVARAPVGLRTD